MTSLWRHTRLLLCEITDEHWLSSYFKLLMKIVGDDKYFGNLTIGKLHYIAVIKLIIDAKYSKISADYLFYVPK